MKTGNYSCSLKCKSCSQIYQNIWECRKREDLTANAKSDSIAYGSPCDCRLIQINGGFQQPQRAYYFLSILEFFINTMEIFINIEEVNLVSNMRNVTSRWHLFLSQVTSNGLSFSLIHGVKGSMPTIQKQFKD